MINHIPINAIQIFAVHLRLVIVNHGTPFVKPLKRVAYDLIEIDQCSIEFHS